MVIYEMVIIQIKQGDKSFLDSIKEHPRETYGDTITRLIDCWTRNMNVPLADSKTEDDPSLGAVRIPVDVSKLKEASKSLSKFKDGNSSKEFSSESTTFTNG